MKVNKVQRDRTAVHPWRVKGDCNRTSVTKGCSPHVQIRLTSFFDWIDDPQYAGRAVKGLKSWKITNAHRLTVVDRVNIDYVLGCYQ